MSNRPRVKAPDADAILKRFRHPAVLALRPVLLGGIALLGTVRRYRWTSYGSDKLAQLEQPLILASNHCSHADTAAILGTLPYKVRRQTCVAAALDVFGPAAYVHNRTFKAFKRACLQIIVAAGFRAFAFDRLGPPLRSIRTAEKLLEQNWNLLLYPEGTRSRTGEMAEFKPGVGLLAKKTGRPVVPGHVFGGSDILPCKALIPRPGQAIVRFGRPLYRAPDESPVKFTRRIEEQVRKLERVAIRDQREPRLFFAPRAPRFASVGRGSVGDKG
jgi:1-acyl-sn-glycerol-3-phosphate acyltransferase